MKLGYACIPITMQYRTNRRFVLKNFTQERFLIITRENLEGLLNILKGNKDNQIYLFRISSDIIPFGSHEINHIKWWKIYRKLLLEIGEYINNNSMRVSMHPGQYTVLNSNNEDTVKRAINDIEYHTKVLDSMELDYSHKIVIHVGGTYGNKASAIKNFTENFKRLSSSSRKRLVLENDDKSYTIKDVLSISNDISIPIVFDVFHHECNPSDIGIEDIMKQVVNTWTHRDGNVKLHYSNANKDKKIGSHSKFIYTNKFIDFYKEIKEFDPDIMFEVKDKDISTIKCINTIKELKNKQGFNKKKVLTREWSRYKYLVMEKDYSFYKEANKLVNREVSIKEFYEFVDNVCLLPNNDKSFINAAEYVFGYFKNKASEREKQYFNKLIKDFNDHKKVKLKLKKLALKYNQKYLLDSYYFRDV